MPKSKKFVSHILNVFRMGALALAVLAVPNPSPHRARLFSTHLRMRTIQLSRTSSLRLPTSFRLMDMPTLHR